MNLETNSVQTTPVMSCLPKPEGLGANAPPSSLRDSADHGGRAERGIVRMLYKPPSAGGDVCSHHKEGQACRSGSARAVSLCSLTA